jgi:signal transduction histidine kinase
MPKPETGYTGDPVPRDTERKRMTPPGAQTSRAPLLWLGYLALGLAATAVYVSSETQAVKAATIIAAALAAPVAILAGIRLHRPAHQVAWLCFAATQLLWAAGWIWWETKILADGVPPATDSLVNLLFLTSYPLLVAGLLLLLWKRERDAVGLVDVGILVASLAGVAWAVLLHKYVDDEIPVLGRSFQISYAVLDVIVLAAAARLLATPGKRPWALWLLAGSAVFAVTSDGIWNWSTHIDDYSPGSWADAGWILFAVLGGAAALHPSMATLERWGGELTRKVDPARFALLVIAALVPAFIMIYTQPVDVDAVQVIPAAGSAALLSLLVLVRMALIVRGETRLAAALADQNERLRDLDRIKDDFVAAVSHELRTPLTSIRGYLDLVREGEAGDLTSDQERFLDVVDRNADRLLHVVGDLLFVAQVDAGKLELELEHVDLAALAAYSVEAARPHAEDRGIQLSLVVDGPVELSGDPARLGQLLDNLITNALKFTPGGGRVEVRTAAGDGHALVDVVDTGMGIPDADRERLFDRFFRTAAASTQAIPGTGLGLAIVKAIAEGHGGGVAVDSEEGVGTTFRVRLPLERRDLHVVEEGQRAEVAA